MYAYWIGIMPLGNDNLEDVVGRQINPGLVEGRAVRQRLMQHLFMHQ